MIQWPIQMRDVERVERVDNIYGSHLAYNPIAEGEWLWWNDTNRKSFTGILYKSLLVMFYAAVWKAVVLQMKWLRAR